RLLYVSCALYEDRMLNLYPKGVDLMIVNTTLYRKVVPIDHLTVEDAYRLIVNLKPRKAVLTHFGYELLMQHDPKELAMELSKRCGVPVVAAEDFMEVEL
ncbi:MAG: MBL fold metallo-hydrolase, partial [Aquificaceae bacterium]|nr:MBL fold metallo-hydrolase [Aquificaceae bacterium]